MHYLNEGDKILVQGSGKKPYEVKKVGGVVSCTCMAWKNMGGSLDVRVCKHIKKEIDPACLLPQAQSQAVASGQPFPATASMADLAPSQPKAVEVPPLLLAHSFEDEDPSGWWMSEKLDGVRAYWDGTKFISRLGNEYHAPEWFKLGMPQRIKLDGELFAGRKKFQQTVSTVRKLVPDDQEWGDITYVVFDTLSDDGTFEERQEALRNLERLAQSRGEHFWRVLKQEVCKSVEHLRHRLVEVETIGGEGLMLRQPGSKYEAGRSHTLLKVKSFFDDEATVIGTKEGKGKHKGRMGALVCRMKSGTEFDVGSGFTDRQRENPPGIGTKITYRYQELTRDGVPRFPTFVSARDYE